MNFQNPTSLAKQKPPPPQSLSERLQRMLRHTWLIGIGLTLLAAGLVAAVLYIQSRPTHLKIAVGPRTGEDIRLIQALSQHFARERMKIRLHVVRKETGAESSEALDKGEVELAVVRRDAGMPKNGQVIAVHRRNVAVLIVPPAATPAPAAAKRKGKAAAVKPIEKVEDLAGKTVAIVGRTPANNTLLNAILAQYGVPADKVTRIQFTTEDLTTQLKAAKYDALLAVGPIASKVTTEAVAAAASRGKQPPKFLEIGSSEAIEQQNPVYESTEIQAGAFGVSRPVENVETIGVSHYIVAHRDLDEKLAGDFTRLLFAAKQTLADDNHAFSKIESPDTDKAASLAVHPGALAYLEGEQKTFFDRYSEPLYWGLMLLSFLGSGAAWLASYSRSDGDGDTTDLEALIGIVPRARTAMGADELDIMRSEVDAIMERSIRHIESGNLEGSRSEAVRLAADHARTAISERRGMLKA
jgi:TRAP transporter TAXI family solute receptor